mmetsp:Transcript_44287/g.139063  ORF Transcript_44287/g.139063 Transcript_44287/m.139063 type:complete len:632 (+) Transcript_44287:779-2674(+)
MVIKEPRADAAAADLQDGHGQERRGPAAVGFGPELHGHGHDVRRRLALGAATEEVHVAPRVHEGGDAVQERRALRWQRAVALRLELGAHLVGAAAEDVRAAHEVARVRLRGLVAVLHPHAPRVEREELRQRAAHVPQLRVAREGPKVAHRRSRVGSGGSGGGVAPVGRDAELRRRPREVDDEVGEEGVVLEADVVHGLVLLDVRRLEEQRGVLRRRLLVLDAPTLLEHAAHARRRGAAAGAGPAVPEVREHAAPQVLRLAHVHDVAVRRLPDVDAWAQRHLPRFLAEPLHVRQPHHRVQYRVRILAPYAAVVLLRIERRGFRRGRHCRSRRRFRRRRCGGLFLGVLLFCPFCPLARPRNAAVDLLEAGLLARDVEDAFDFAPRRGPRLATCRLVVRLLPLPPPLRLAHAARHGGADAVGEEDGAALRVARRAADALDEAAVVAQEALLVGVEDGDEAHLGQVQALAQQIHAHDHVEVAHLEPPQHLGALRRAEVAVQVVAAHALLVAEEVAEVLGVALRERHDERAAAGRGAGAHLGREDLELPLRGQHLDYGIEHVRWADVHLHDVAAGAQHLLALEVRRRPVGVLRGEVQLEAARRRRHEDALRDAVPELRRGERPVVERAGQAKAVRD